jgi:hypothetical protein
VNAVTDQEQQNQRRQVRRTMVFLVAVAVCFYFGFIIATGLKA